MGEVYRRLGEVLPPGTRLDLPFAADAKRAAAWAEALPRADVGATRRQLLRALEALASSPSLKGGARREIADVLRPLVLDVALSTRTAYQAKPLPLAGELGALPGELAQLHLRLAHAYRLAASDLCAPSGSLPWLRGGQVSEALQRATYHYGEAMLVAWRVYASLPADAWRGLHRCRQFAVARELDRRPCNDPLVPGLAPLHQHYVQLLLMAAAHPRGFAQLEQDRVWGLAAQFVDASPLRDAPTPTSVGVPDDADEGPGGKAPPRQWLDLVGFAAAIEAGLSASHSDKAIVVPPQALGQEFPVDMLQKLRRAFSHAAARQFLRLDGGHGIDTLVGLSGLHHVASGGRDFDAFARDTLGPDVEGPLRAAWSAGSGEASARPQIAMARVLDQSLGGYRVSWSAESAPRLRVGEIVGLRAEEGDDEDSWMLGLVRWLRYSPGGELGAGIELVSRGLAPVALLPGSTAAKLPLRALELRPTWGEDEWLYLTAQRLPQGDEVTLGRGGDPVDDALEGRPQGRLAGLRLLQVHGDYFLYRYAPPKAASN